MYNVLIIEDEMLVRVGIKASINWAKFDMRIIGDAVDGVSGLSMFKELKPDILITDINLPRLDGVELIKKIREFDSQCAIIVISCVDDFSVLRELLNYDIVDYLLKSSINTKNVEATLMAAKKKLSSSKIEKKDNFESRDNEEMILNSFLLDEISGDKDCELAEEILCEYNPCFLLLYLKDIKSNYHIICNTVIELLIKYFKPYSEIYTLIKDDYKLLVIIKDTNLLKDNILEITANFQKYVLKTLNLKVVCSVEVHSNDSKKLKTIFNQFCDYVSHISLVDTFPNVYKSITQLCHKQIGKLVGLTFNLFTPYMLNTPLGHLRDEHMSFLSKENYNYNDFLHIINRTIINVASVYDTINTDSVRDLEQQVLLSNTYLDVYKRCRRFMCEYYYSYDMHIHVKQEVRQCITYVHMHFADVITLEGVAREVSLSPNYLSSLFKKELGMSFVDFLIYYRIEKAKIMLEETDDYLYIVAAETGFSNESYFSKTFKKWVGFSPNEWRKMMRK